MTDFPKDTPPAANGAEQPTPEQVAAAPMPLAELAATMQQTMKQLGVAVRQTLEANGQLASNAQLYFDQVINESGHAAFAKLVKAKLGITTEEFIIEHIEMLKRALASETMKAQAARKILPASAGIPPRRPS